MKRKIFSLLLLQLVCSGLLAQDLLEPGRAHIDLYGGYGEKTRFVLRRAFEDDVVVRIETFPSFSYERVVGLRKAEHGWFVFCVIAKQQVWPVASQELMNREQIRELSSGGNDEEFARFKKMYPNGYRGIDADYRERPVSVEAAELLVEALELAVASAEVPKQPLMGCDGETYIVWVKRGQGEAISANTWSPPAGSLCGRVVALASDLTCYAQGTAEAPKLVAKAGAITTELKNRDERRPASPSPASDSARPH